MNTRIKYFDVLRVLSAFFVIMIHVSAQYWYDAPVASSLWQCMSAYDIIGMAGVPVFFMLSGALMLNPDKPVVYKKLFLRVFGLFIIYHFWLTFYNFLPFLMGEKSISELNLIDIVYNVANGRGIYHLWFLPTLTIIYLASPVLKEFCKNKKVTEYFLMLFVIIGIIFPSIFLFDFPHKDIIESIYSRYSLGMFTGYAGYFVAGHYIHSHLEIKNIKKAKILSIIIAIFGFSTTILINGIDAIRKGSASTLANTPLDFSEFISACGLFVFVKLCLGSKGQNKSEWLSKLAPLTFGIYLIHPLVIEIFMKLGMNTMIPHTIIMIPVFTALIFTVSGIIIFIIKKIPVIKFLIS